MSCRCQSSPSLPKPAARTLPCLTCALEHLDLAQDAADCNLRHRAVWHLARAGELAPAAAKHLRAARIAFQTQSRLPNWNKLREEIK